MENKGLKRFIWVVSVVVPVLVAVLLFVPIPLRGAFDVSCLPATIAIINSTTAILLISALIAIKKGNIQLHKKLMLSAFCLGAVFLLTYVLYHTVGPKTYFGDVNHDLVVSEEEIAAVGSLRTVYFIVLLSHILLSIIVLPFVLFSLYYGVNNMFEKHKKIVKLSFPIWLYVSITGIIVYFMIQPYYIWN